MTQIFGEASDAVEAMLIGDAERKQRIRERHARESAALAAARAGSNREAVRKAKKLQKIAPDLWSQVQAGVTNIDAAYREATGDNRVSLFLKLEAHIDEQFQDAADDLGKTRQQLVAQLIHEFLDVTRAERNGWVL